MTEEIAQSKVLETPNIKTLADSFVPQRMTGYVPFGFYNDLKNIVSSKIFYPVYITGLSGNGKTLMVDQVCAEVQREMIRVNITKETDEFDLIGAYELVNGDTVWRDGPVIVALKRGAILLLDETDLGSERLLCLQPILEGKGYFNKKRGELIYPTYGFNIMATANTKGKGSDDGKFIGANVLNEAYLERFAITVEQDYPSEKTEKTILMNLFAELDTTPGMYVEKFSANLAKWAELIRKSYKDGVTDEIISTRRLTHIARAYAIFRNRKKAIELCLNRFDEEIKATFLDFYSKIDPDLEKKIVEPGDLPPNHPQTKVGPITTTINIGSTNIGSPPNLAALRKQAQAAQASSNGSPIASTVQFQGSNITGTVIFGDARNIAAVTAKYGIPVKVDRNKTTGGATITALGTSVTVNAGDIMNAQDDLLDRVTKNIIDKVANMDDTATDTGDDDD